MTTKHWYQMRGMILLVAILFAVCGCRDVMDLVGWKSDSTFEAAEDDQVMTSPDRIMSQKRDWKRKGPVLNEEIEVNNINKEQYDAISD